MVGNDPSDSINLEWVWVALDLDVSLADIGIDRTVRIECIDDCKVRCYERITRPIKQASW